MLRLKQAVILTGFIFTLLLLMSCSTSAPTVPSDLICDSSDYNSPILISNRDMNGNPTDGIGMLGAFFLNVETDPLSCELVPVRNASITDSLEVIDITNFLSLAPCKDCITIRNIGFNEDGQIVMSIGIKHPFDIGTLMEPISGKNRIDLHVFNIEGIFILKGGTSGTIEFADNKIVKLGGLANPSGFTPYLAPYLYNIMPTIANLHPYILHFNAYHAGNYMPGFFDSGFSDVFHPSGNLIMAQGSDYDFKDYTLDLENGYSYQVLFAVGCSYGISAFDYTERFLPKYRIPQFNKKAASEVFVSLTNNQMLEGNTSGTATVQVKVLDMSHGVEVGTLLDKMSHDSSVSRIIIEVPEIMTLPILEDNPVEISGGPRNPSDPLLYEYTITNELDAAAGFYTGLVTVEDSFPTGTNAHPFLEQHDAAHSVPVGVSALTGLFDIIKFATYQVFEYEILPSMTFELLALMPYPRSYARAAVVGDIIYVVGGMIGVSPLNARSDRIDAYDPVANTWNVSLTPMPTARAGMAVAAVGEFIYVIGGLLESGSGSTDVMEIYDTTLDTWATAPTPLPGVYRHGMGCVAKDDIIYIVGGYNSGQHELNLVHRFDTALESWGELLPMVGKRTQFAMTIKDDYIYVVGGDPVVGIGSEEASKIEVFDTVASEWSYPLTVPSIADIAPDPYIGVLGPCWENVGGNIVFAGGAYDMDLLEDKVYVYDEVTETFFHVGQLLLPRLLFASASWNNHIFLFSGIALDDADPPQPYLSPTAEKGIW